MKNILAKSRRVLISWRFLLNVVIILVATSWIPLMTRTMVMRDEAGAVIQETKLTARLYESWWIVATMKPAMNSHARAVFMHLAICIVISFAVWYMSMPGDDAKAKDAPEQPAAANGDAEAGPE